MKLLSIKPILFLALTTQAYAVESSTYSCKDYRSPKIQMTLNFEGKKLVDATIKNVGYRKFPKTLKMKSQDLEKSYGSNSETKYAHYRYDLNKAPETMDPYYRGDYVFVSFGYPIVHLGKNLTLDQSLVEKNVLNNGWTHGELRFDIEFDPGFGESMGSTYLFNCKKI